MSSTLEQVREISDLPASVARLEVRHAVIVSILQEPRRMAKAKWSIESGGVYLHDPVDLAPELVGAMPEQVWIRRATRSRDGTRFAIVSMPVGGPYGGTVRVVGRDGAELASRSWGNHMAWDCAWFRDDLVISTINAPTKRSENDRGRDVVCGLGAKER